MNKKIKKITLFLAIIFAFFLRASFVLALELHYPTIMGFSINDTSTLPEYARYLFNIGMALAGFLAVIVIAVGGVSYLVSYGRGKFTDEGKDQIKAGVSGLLIVVCAYLIAYTINPDLVAFKLGGLPQIFFQNPSNGTTPTGVEITSYQEIPIGTLTENLLTETTDCYGFDAEGNPIDGEQMTTDNGKKIAGPTYTNHDIADCLVQLTDGAQKKTQMIALLSDEIIKLMNQCDCQKYGSCQDTCNGTKTDAFGQSLGCDKYAGICPLPEGVSGSCTGACVPDGSPFKGACKQAQGTKDCCPEGVKDQIEHGPIDVGGSCGSSDSNSSSYNNLKNNNKITGILNSGIKNNFLLASIGGCQTSNPYSIGYCSGVCINGVCLSGGGGGSTVNGTCDLCDVPKITYGGLDEFRCPVPGLKFQQCSGIPSLVTKQVQVNEKTITIIDQDNWNQLNLTQQLTFFQEEISSVKGKIQASVNALDQAKTTLGQCYLAIPYVDLLKTYETTDQNQHIILAQKTADTSKYCTGFNYGNSSCFKKCNDMCPDASDQAIQCYRNCSTCKGDDTDCLDKQETCIENCYNSRPCIYGKNTSQTFNGDKDSNSCISSCQNDYSYSCSDICSKKYLQGTNDYNTCQNQCNNDSQCILNNTGNCLFGAEGFKECTNQITDPGNTKHCIDNAYLCKNGSDEYASYPDCYNSSGNSKCPAPYSPPDEGTFCYDRTKPDASCQELCPETTKCPDSSNCPDCPCDQIDQTLGFCVPNSSTSSVIGSKNDNTGNAGNEGYGNLSQKVSANEIVGPQCNEYSYNDDPLTFYCENSWWNDPTREGNSPTPIGTERICPKEGEVPVGQTVDDAENWANGVIDAANNAVQDIYQTLGQMKKAGDAEKTQPVQDYCKCNAKIESNKPICTTNCQYNQVLVDNPIIDPTTGEQTGDDWEWVCSCNFMACSGGPCEQIVDYISHIWDFYKQLKLDFINFYADNLRGPRSNVLKELTYSRQQTNSCSLVNSAYGLNARLLDCTRVEDELIPPINTGKITFDNKTIDAYCYGEKLGSLFSASLTDNWFCCNELQKTTKATTGEGQKDLAPTPGELEMSNGELPK